MITRFQVENYRAFRSACIHPAKLTIIVGPNNSGKSALISGIALLNQTLRSGDQQVPLLLRGDLEDLGTYRDAVYNNRRGNHMRFALDFNLTKNRYGHVPQTSLQVDFGYRSQRREIFLSTCLLQMPIGRKLFESRVVKESGNHIIRHIGDGPPAAGSQLVKIESYDHFLPRGHLLIDRSDMDSYKLARRVDVCTRSISNQLTGVEFIGPFRAAPNRTYLFTGESPAHVGRHGERAVDILVSDFLKRGSKRIGIATGVSRWLGQCGIADDLDINVLTDRHFEIILKHPITGEQQNLADVGYGCSQLLPILVAGINSGPGTVFAVEQPELHLHPRAQAELGDFFASLALNDVQCIVETHSEHLLLRVQSAIASLSNPLTEKDVAVYYVHAPTDAEKCVTPLPLRPDGFFDCKWPNGFFPERMEEARRLAEQAMLRREQECDQDV